MKEIIALIDKLNKERQLTKDEWIKVLDGQCQETIDYAAKLAREAREPFYGKDVYVRGLIEFSNICKNDCIYCGIRKSNKNANRYRLTKEEILSCCKEGYELGFRTFVLQSGEDRHFSDEVLGDIIRSIKELYPDCAITLGVGERSKESYQYLFDAGADRYLLRHETASQELYSKLHPEELSLDNRIQCLYNLKEIGYQIGAGFMVGAPFQTNEHLAEDYLFLKKLNPHMVGIGPFIPHHDTPFADQPIGSLEQSLYCLSLVRIMLPAVLLPSTTALGTIHPKGREMGMEAGCNVVMPNLSPTEVRKDYLLYDNKICMGDEAAQARLTLERRMEAIGYRVVSDRGDSKNI